MEKTALKSFGDWVLVRPLGQGGFGVVHHWRNRHTQQEVATKMLKKNITLSRDEVEKLKTRWGQEHNWMDSFKLSFIVQGVDVKDAAFAAYLNERHAWPQLPVIVMEYCNGGDMRSHLRAMHNLNGLHEYEVREVLNAMRQAVEYLHSVRKIKHRDLKPDNIVVHVDGRGQRHYKLTDFGFASVISEQTLLNSIVGTRNYFAPEIVDTAMYTNSVDYWSLGVIAFELMCGAFPFLPHQPLVTFLTAVKKKSSECIAITEEYAPALPADRAAEMPKFIEKKHILAEHRLSSVFVRKMEEWLRLALDVNYRTRGRRPLTGTSVTVDGPSTSAAATAAGGNGTLAFYTELDAVLSTKILTVFSMNTYRFHSFEVTPEQPFRELVEAIVSATSLPIEKLYFTFPTGHPCPHVPEKAIDWFVEKWQDTSDTSNPPVMVYIIGMECEYYAPSPEIPELIKRCLCADHGDQWPEWALLQLVRQTHFLLSNEQRHLVAFVDGMKEYAISVENELFHFDKPVDGLADHITMTCGRGQQFLHMLECAKSINVAKSPQLGPFFDNWLAKAHQLCTEINKVNDKVGQSIREHYRSVKRRLRELATDKRFDEWPKKDIYALTDFRAKVETLSSRNLKACQTAVRRCIDKRRDFLEHLTFVRQEGESLHMEAKKIVELVANTNDYLVTTIDARLAHETMLFHAELANRSNGMIGLQLQMHSLSLGSASKVQDPCVSLDDIFHLPVRELVNDATDIAQLMELDMVAGTDDTIPTTIHR